MFTAADLRSFALSLDGTTEVPHFDRAAFRVPRGIFATLAPSGVEAMVKLADPALVGELLLTQPEVFFSYGGWTTTGGALGVHLARVDPDQIRGLLTQAWEARRAPPPPRKRAR